ncbi:MAG TPA: hypothetical protein VGD91_32370, partial [Trebonia sp.]
MEPSSEIVLAGSAVHVQCHAGTNAWRMLSDTYAMRHDQDLSKVPHASWRPWTGDFASVAQMSLPRKRQGVLEKWWILAGELPSPGAIVNPVIGNGYQPEVCFIQGRLWACEWSGEP